MMKGGRRMPPQRRKTGLSVVKADHKTEPLPEPPKTVRQAVESSERDLLVALRNKIASDIDKGVPAHALAPLSRQLRELDRDIRALDAEKDGDEVGAAVSTPDEEWATS